MRLEYRTIYENIRSIRDIDKDIKANMRRAQDVVIDAYEENVITLEMNEIRDKAEELLSLMDKFNGHLDSICT